MVFQLSYDKQEEIPTDAAAYTDMFTEVDGKWVLGGVTGLKTQADIDRQQLGLGKERTAHTKTKAQLAIWGEMDHAETVAKLDRIVELEAAAGDKLDQAGIDEIVNKRVDGVLASKMAPLQRDLKTRTEELVKVTETNIGLSADAVRRHREDVLRPLMNKAKIVSEHQEDVLMYAERQLEIPDGQTSFFARDGIDQVTGGNTPTDWLSEILERRPGWLPGSQGGGARGSGSTGGGFSGGNPWTAETWNMTSQGAIVRSRGMEYANKMAAAAGTTVGGLKPPPKG